MNWVKRKFMVLYVDVNLKLSYSVNSDKITWLPYNESVNHVIRITPTINASIALGTWWCERASLKAGFAASTTVSFPWLDAGSWSRSRSRYAPRQVSRLGTRSDWDIEGVPCTVRQSRLWHSHFLSLEDIFMHFTGLRELGWLLGSRMVCCG